MNLETSVVLSALILMSEKDPSLYERVREIAQNYPEEIQESLDNVSSTSFDDFDKALVELFEGILKGEVNVG